jgi:hypothetical protein
MIIINSSQRFHSSLTLLWFGSKYNATRSRSAFAQHGRYGLMTPASVTNSIRKGTRTQRRDNFSAGFLLIRCCCHERSDESEIPIWRKATVVIITKKQTKTVNMRTARCGA